MRSILSFKSLTKRRDAAVTGDNVKSEATTRGAHAQHTTLAKQVVIREPVDDETPSTASSRSTEPDYEDDSPAQMAEAPEQSFCSSVGHKQRMIDHSKNSLVQQANGDPYVVASEMRNSEFFKTDVGADTIPKLAHYFELVSFNHTANNAPLFRHGDDQQFVGVILSGALTVRDVDGNPAYSLAKDDTIGETLVAVSRQGLQQNDMLVRSPGKILCSTIEQLEELQMRHPLLHRKLIDAFIAKCMARTLVESQYQPITAENTRGPYVALIAHDAKKEALVEFCIEHRDVLARCKLAGTATTCSALLEKVGLKSAFKVPSGPLGGDQSIGALIAHDLVDAVIFMKDSLAIQCHYADIEALCHLCDVRNVLHATNGLMGAAVVHRLNTLMDMREGIVHVEQSTEKRRLAQMAKPNPHASIMLREQTAIKPNGSDAHTTASASFYATSEAPSTSSMSLPKEEEQELMDKSLKLPCSLSSASEQSRSSSVFSAALTRLKGLSSYSSTPLLEHVESAAPSAAAATKAVTIGQTIEMEVESLAVELSKHALFESLSAEEVERLAELMSITQLERGERIVEAGSDADYALIVLIGRLEVLDGSTGAVTCSLRAGEMYGEDSVILDEAVSSWEESIEAARRSTVALLPREEVQRLRTRASATYHHINLWLGVMAMRGRTENENVQTHQHLARKYIILTCDNTPSAYEALTLFVKSNRAFFTRHQKELIGPEDVLADVSKTTGLSFVHSVQAPLLGGAMELGDLVCRTRVRAAVVFRDHRCVDRCAFEALLRLTDLYAVPCATNPASAECLVRFLGDNHCPI